MRTFKFDNQSFSEFGFCIFREYLDSKELKELEEIAVPYLTQKNVPDSVEDDSFLCIKKVIENNSQFKNFLEDKGINNILQSIHKSDFKFLRNDIMIKKPNGKIDEYWHRDFDFFPTYNLVTCVIALSSSSMNSAGFSVVEKSHNKNFENRISTSNLEDIIKVDKDNLRRADIELNSGDLLFLHPLTYHTGSSNLTKDLKTTITIITSPTN